MTSRFNIPFRTLAVGLTAAAALAGGTAAPDARASLSDKPCWSNRIVVKEDVRTKTGKLLGKVYVFDEGEYLCAVTTSIGTDFWGVPKYMFIGLTIGSKDESDPGRYSKYAGRLRMRDTGKCVSVLAHIKLDSGEQAWKYVECTEWINKR